jgi:serine phosphatase RsbU (regulator of sigma subunit)/anti-sigma regulatory factor (Ser/Thr protein kinase)
VDDPTLAGEAETVRRRFEAVGLMLGSYDGPELRTVAANAALRAVLGRPDLVGRELGEAVPEFAGQQVLALGRRVWATGERQVGREWRFTVEHEGVPREGFADFVLEPYRGPEGEIVGVTAYAVDVTEQVLRRRAAEARTAAAQARFERAREMVSALQDALLPAGLPVLPGVRLGATYLLAEEDSAAGGDWFDALAVPDGRVALVVGDVVGHGVAAAAVMSQLRAVLAERLGAGADLPAALTAVDGFARRTPGARAATVCVALLDPETGVVEYCTAGHPPPLRVSAVDETGYLPTTGARPLGVGARFGAADVRTAHLDDGEVLLLYTDGILERPGRDLSASTVELLTVADDALAGRVAVGRGMIPADRVAMLPLELLVRETGHTDDTTLLAAQRVPPVEALRLELPAHVGSLAAARAALTIWLDQHEIGLATQSDLQHAVGELVTNAVEHAYGTADPERDTVVLRADLTPAGAVAVAVADRGGWTGPPADGRGLGLAMVGELMDEVEIDRAAAGTTVAATARAERPAHLLRAEHLGAVAPRVPAAAGELVVREAEGGLRVAGPVDGHTARRLRQELLRWTRGGTRPVEVDLSGVTLLSSAGVGVLHGLTGARLFAPPHSPAGQILTLVGLPHEDGPRE